MPGVNPAHVHGNVCAQSVVAWGDVEAGFRQADHIFEHTFTTSTVHQSYLEPMATVAQYEPGGKLTIWTSTQGTYVVRSRVASLLGLPMHKVRVIVPHVGGGFGGKLQTVLEPYCALLAQRTGRPVKIVMSREEEFFLGKPRSAGVLHLKTGVTRDGLLVARQARMYFDTGFACHPRSSEIAPTIVRGPYNIPHVRFEAYSVYTNKMGCGSFRGPGGIQAHFAGESQIDIICRELGMDPIDFRRRNGVQEGGTSGAGVRLRRVGMREALDRAADTVHWDKPLPSRARQKGRAWCGLRRVAPGGRAWLGSLGEAERGRDRAPAGWHERDRQWLEYRHGADRGGSFRGRSRRRGTGEWRHRDDALRHAHGGQSCDGLGRECRTARRCRCP